MEKNYEKIISKPLIKWWRVYGRKNLPWQKNPSVYKTWVSEIMLQQTQVSTVLDYFKEFIKRFPNLKKLAEADIDDVLSLWSGLGYYSRARNLHRTSIMIRNEHKGRFPKKFDNLLSLPGIGPSTAGAILSLSNIDSRPILDGNVKRVLARFHGVYGHSSNSFVSKKLWHLSSLSTPKENFAIYTQAIMDLGATVCLIRNPNCNFCPLSKHCFAYQNNLIHDLPTRKKTKKKKTIAEYFMIIRYEDKSFILEKRDEKGIWGGLWSLPQVDIQDDPLLWCKDNFSNKLIEVKELDKLKHNFSHYNLEIHPIEILLKGKFKSTNKNMKCFKKNMISKLGLAAPIKIIINSL